MRGAVGIFPLLAVLVVLGAIAVAVDGYNVQLKRETLVAASTASQGGQCEQTFQWCLKLYPRQLCESDWRRCVQKKCVSQSSAAAKQCLKDPDCESSCTESATSREGLLSCCRGGPRHYNSCRKEIDGKCNPSKTQLPDIERSQGEGDQPPQLSQAPNAEQADQRQLPDDEMSVPESNANERVNDAFSQMDPRVLEHASDPDNLRNVTPYPELDYPLQEHAEDMGKMIEYENSEVPPEVRESSVYQDLIRLSNEGRIESMEELKERGAYGFDNFYTSNDQPFSYDPTQASTFEPYSPDEERFSGFRLSENVEDYREPTFTQSLLNALYPGLGYSASSWVNRVNRAVYNFFR